MLFALQSASGISTQQYIPSFSFPRSKYLGPTEAHKLQSWEASDSQDQSKLNWLQQVTWGFWEFPVPLGEHKSVDISPGVHVFTSYQGIPVRNKVKKAVTLKKENL
jgi:hypothetical protein